MSALEQEYRGHKITFIEKKELWSARVKVPQGDDFTDIEDASLSVVKNFIDKNLKKGFKRIEVFVDRPYNFSWKKDTRPKIITAVITSISPDGDIFIVYQGEKTAHKNRSSPYENTVANKKLIDEINDLEKQKAQIETELEKKEVKLVRVDTNKILQEFLKK